MNDLKPPIINGRYGLVLSGREGGKFVQALIFADWDGSSWDYIHPESGKPLEISSPHEITWWVRIKGLSPEMEDKE